MLSQIFSLFRSTVVCPACDGTGEVTLEEESVIPAAALSGAVLGALVGGSAGCGCGCLAGIFLCAGKTFKVQEKCSHCAGAGRVASNKSTTLLDHLLLHCCSGKTMKMFHGTTAANAQSIMKNGFKPSSGGMLGPGVYVSADIEKAKRYGTSILILEVKLGKTKRIDSQSHPMRTSWNSHGYDSAWVPPNCGMVPSGLTENMRF
eukprot:Skav207450  [mRNA]  locus=scaffold3545:35731:36342:+ [translate_table: standard]